MTPLTLLLSQILGNKPAAAFLTNCWSAKIKGLVCRTLKEQALVSTLRSVPGMLIEGTLTAHLKLSAENQNGGKLSKTNKKTNGCSMNPINELNNPFPHPQIQNTSGDIMLRHRSN